MIHPYRFMEYLDLTLRNKVDKVERIIRNHRRTEWDHYTRYLSNNMAYLLVGNVVRSELEF